MIYTITLNPSLDKTAQLDELLLEVDNDLKAVQYDIGGKGINVSKTIASLGGKTSCITILAGKIGMLIKSYFNDDFPVDIIECNGNNRVNFKIVHPKGGLTTFNGQGFDWDDSLKEQLCDRISDKCTIKDTLVCTGGLPPQCPEDIYYHLMIEAKKKGSLTILDAKGKALKYGLQANPDICKASQKTLASYFSIDENDDDGVIRCASSLISDELAICVVMMNNGRVCFISKDDFIEAQPIKMETISCVGSSSALLGGIAYAYQEKYTFEEMVKVSMAAYSGALTTYGPNPADGELVKKLKRLVDFRRK